MSMYALFCFSGCPEILRSAGRGRSAEMERRKRMRFIHIADVHLGASPDAGPLYSRERAGELWDTFRRVISVCERERADLLLIAGDLFHRQPLVQELKEVNFLFSELSHTKVVLIAGNHDYIRPDSYYRTFEWADNVFPLFGEEMEYIDFPELKTAVYGFSYHSREMADPVYDRAKACGIEPCEILLAHGGDEKHIPIDRRKLAGSGFTYIALGHIHKPQALIRDRAVYAGALEPTDKNDTGPHGYVRGEATEAGLRTWWIPCALREYIHMEIPVSQYDTTGSVGKRIEKEINRFGNENIYKLELTGKRDPDVEFDTEWLAGRGNVTEVIDNSSPAYDFEALYRENEHTVLGRYIRRFSECREGSLEYQALCEGVDALLESRR